MGLLNLYRINYSNDGKLFSSFHHAISYKSHILTVVRPTGVEHVVRVGGEADVQHAPAHVTGLYRSPQVKTPPTGVVQADVLVCSKKNKTKHKDSLLFLFVFFTGPSEFVTKSFFFFFIPWVQTECFISLFPFCL